MIVLLLMSVKLATSRVNKKTGIFKLSLLHHYSCPLWHHQSFIIRFKFNSRSGPVVKGW